MNDVPIARRDGEQQVFNEMASHYDAPAYVRRARTLQDAQDAVLNQCRRQRDEWLGPVRTQLGLLHALAGDYGILRPWLDGDAGNEALRQLHALLEPRLRARIEPTTSPRVLLQALRRLALSVERFNRRWEAFLPTINLTAVNRLREDYNHYFLLEKECSIRSYRVAMQGYQRLALMTVEDLRSLLPPLPVVAVK